MEPPLMSLGWPMSISFDITSRARAIHCELLNHIRCLHGIRLDRPYDLSLLFTDPQASDEGAL